MRFLYQSGVSMLQGLVVSSVLAGSALVATRMVQDQKKLQKGVETRDQIEQLHRVIYSILQNKEHCKATLIASGVGTAAVPVDLNLTRSISAIYSAGSGTPTFEVNTGASYDANKIYMNGNVMINSITFRTPHASDPAGQNLITYPSRLRIEYSRLEGNDANKRTKSGYGAKRINKDIMLMVQRDTDPASPTYRQFSDTEGCYAVQLGESINSVTNEGNANLNQEFCSDIGNGASLYTWDSLSNKCVLKNNVCPEKHVFTGISSTGNAVCYPVENFLPEMIDTSTTSCSNPSSVKLEPDANGKVRIICNP